MVFLKGYCIFGSSLISAFINLFCIYFLFCSGLSGTVQRHFSRKILINFPSSFLLQEPRIVSHHWAILEEGKFNMRGKVCHIHIFRTERFTIPTRPQISWKNTSLAYFYNVNLHIFDIIHKILYALVFGFWVEAFDASFTKQCIYFNCVLLCCYSVYNFVTLYYAVKCLFCGEQSTKFSVMSSRMLLL